MADIQRPQRASRPAPQGNNGAGGSVPAQKTQPPAGWYPNPAGGNGKRYWDGQKWGITDTEYHERKLAGKKPNPARPDSQLNKPAAGAAGAVFMQDDSVNHIAEEASSVDGSAAQGNSDKPNAPTVNVIDTDSSAENGLKKCPKCGSSEVHHDIAKNTLVCLHCRNRWSAVENFNEKYDLNTPIFELKGSTITSGAKNIDAGAEDLITIKCQGCGSEVVIHTEQSVSSRCHWCRQQLSINSQIPNGAVPDAILPFKLTRDQAVEHIKEFAGKRTFFAHKKFKSEFKPENVIGVYMPYLIVDGHAHVKLSGIGEIETKRWRSDNTTYYNADRYRVAREFDIAVDDHTLEASEERGNMNTALSTNNVINTILPFDTDQIVPFNSSYMLEHTSEKRDVSIDDIAGKAYWDFLGISRASVLDSLKRYGRGVSWKREEIDVKGVRWVSAYLPVWLYSYYHEEKGKGMVHYIAVNGRTGETMGSIPMNKGLLMGISIPLSVIPGSAVTIALLGALTSGVS